MGIERNGSAGNVWVPGLEMFGKKLQKISTYVQNICAEKTLSSFKIVILNENLNLNLLMLSQKVRRCQFKTFYLKIGNL